jgi:hypothetical protein
MKRVNIVLVAFFGFTTLVGMVDDGYDELSMRLSKLTATRLFEAGEQGVNALHTEGVAQARISLQRLQQMPVVYPQIAAASGARSLLSWLDNVSWLDLTVVPASLMALFVIAKHALR